MTAVERIKLADAIEDEYAKSEDMVHAHSHLRYELVRRLSPREFSDIARRALSGRQTFDEIIDELIIATK